MNNDIYFYFSHFYRVAVATLKYYIEELVHIKQSSK